VGIVCTLAYDRAFSDPAAEAAARVHMTDPGALALIVLSIIVVAVVACLVPIRRAASLDPVEALRS
jgi:hypothetical protein